MSQRPPWVIVVRLPDDCPPVDASKRGFSAPEGSDAWAFCSEPAVDLLDLKERLMKAPEEES